MESIVLEMYQAGNWNIEQVRGLVPTVITAEQFTQITGQAYETAIPVAKTEYDPSKSLL